MASNARFSVLMLAPRQRQRGSNLRRIPCTCLQVWGLARGAGTPSAGQFGKLAVEASWTSTEEQEGASARPSKSPSAYPSPSGAYAQHTWGAGGPRSTHSAQPSVHISQHSAQPQQSTSWAALLDSPSSSDMASQPAPISSSHNHAAAARNAAAVYSPMGHIPAQELSASMALSPNVAPTHSLTADTPSSAAHAPGMIHESVGSVVGGDGSTALCNLQNPTQTLHGHAQASPQDSRNALTPSFATRYLGPDSDTDSSSEGEVQGPQGAGWKWGASAPTATEQGSAAQSPGVAQSGEKNPFPFPAAHCPPLIPRCPFPAAHSPPPIPCRPYPAALLLPFTAYYRPLTLSPTH